jgi:hypothetical protein
MRIIYMHSPPMIVVFTSPFEVVSSFSSFYLVFRRSGSSFPQEPGHGRFVRLFPLVLDQIKELYQEHNGKDVTPNRYMYALDEAEYLKILDSLHEESFRFLPLYRVFIPKPGRPGQFRPITIPNPKDVLVMDALGAVLSQLYETIFLDCSHGFRKARGTRTCYWAVLGWKDVHYCITADVVRCFEIIPHARLLDYIGNVVDDPKLLHLISFFLKTPIMDKKGIRYDGERGLPQGCPLSPVLMNIYMHELDMRVQTFLAASPYVHYVRYADNILVGVCGVKLIKQEIILEKLNSLVADLELSLTISIHEKGGPSFLFLGILIKLYGDGHITLFAPLPRISHKITTLFETHQALITPITDPDDLEKQQKSVIELYSHKLVSYLAFYCKGHNSRKTRELLRNKMLTACLLHLAKISSAPLAAIKKKWGPALDRAPVPFITRKQTDSALKNILLKFHREQHKFLKGPHHRNSEDSAPKRRK